MKITDVKCTVLGNNPIVRIVTDEGIDGYGEGEKAKHYLKPHVLFYRDWLIGEDPTDVMRVMRKIRRMGSFKPWGTAVSIIEMALWDIAGKAANLPVYKLMGGKMRDRVRVYNGSIRFPLETYTPQEMAEDAARQKALPEGFTIIKQAISFHGRMAHATPNFFYGDFQPDNSPPHANRGLITEQGMKHMIACVEAMKDVLGDEVGLALDCGPGWVPSDVVQFAKAMEPYNLMWIEDTVNGDYNPFVLADVYRDITMQTSTRIHTGEHIYLRENFMGLIEKQAVDVIGPDPADVGGIAELKWIAEYADLHGILMAPHGTGNGLLGLAAHVNLAATLPDNYIAFEYPTGEFDWWYDIIDWLPDPIVKAGHIDVWDRPGMGVNLVPDKARAYLPDEDKNFFD